MKTQHYHMVFKTSFGYCALLFKEKPFSMVKVLLPAERKNDLKKMVPEEVWGTCGIHPKATATADVITRYFSGKPSGMETPPWQLLDMKHLTLLQQEVLRLTSQIPYGKVLSYKELAIALKRPRAYRFVGSCLAKNPFPVIIPCHRVVRSDLSVGKFGGGSEMKSKMIAMESARTHEYISCKQL